jgi:hypothetical protein
MPYLIYMTNSLRCLLKPWLSSPCDTALLKMKWANSNEYAGMWKTKSCIQLALLFLINAGFSVVAQEHIHGQGQLLISQDEKQWHLQLSLPAADALGFEHAAETEEQKSAFHLLARKLEQNADVVELNGQCILTKAELSMGKQLDNEAHDLHDNDEKHEHQDIEVEYEFNCEAPVTRISVRLFNSMSTVTLLQTQWNNEYGQGLAELSRSHPFVEW